MFRAVRSCWPFFVLTPKSNRLEGPRDIDALFGKAKFYEMRRNFSGALELINQVNFRNFAFSGRLVMLCFAHFDEAFTGTFYFSAGCGGVSWFCACLDREDENSDGVARLGTNSRNCTQVCFFFLLNSKYFGEQFSARRLVDKNCVCCLWQGFELQHGLYTGGTLPDTSHVVQRRQLPRCKSPNITSVLVWRRRPWSTSKTTTMMLRKRDQLWQRVELAQNMPILSVLKLMCVWCFNAGSNKNRRLETTDGKGRTAQRFSLRWIC